MAHRESEAGAPSPFAVIGLRSMTPAERAAGRFMRAPDHGEAAPVTRDSVEDFIASEFLGEDPEEETNDIPEGEEPEGDEVEGEEPETEETTDEEGEAQEEPIAPPVSWDKDAKELFAQLPRELQATVAEREAQRDKAIQSATTEAANAKRTAAAEANSALAETQRQYASHLEQLASQFAPQRPNPDLLATDPQAFYYLQAEFEKATAQQQELLQRAAQAQQEAGQREAFTRQEEIDQNAAILADHFGETWTNLERRQALFTDLEPVGTALGYTKELMSQATATDIIALAKANEWKVKAENYDALQKNKMAAVRAAKDAPRVAKPGTAPSRAEKTSRSRDAAWQRAKQTRSGDDYAAVLENMGIKF